MRTGYPRFVVVDGSKLCAHIIRWAKSMRPQSRLFHPGLQLIGGSPIGNEPNNRVSFACGAELDQQRSPVPLSCPGSTNVRITFAQCWNGRLDAPDNAADPVLGRCPTRFPVALPLIRLVVTTDGRVPAGMIQTSAGGPDRMHADFWNAWDSEVLDSLVAICIRGERVSNREIKRCRVSGTGPRSVGGPDVAETSY